LSKRAVAVVSATLYQQDITIAARKVFGGAAILQVGAHIHLKTVRIRARAMRTTFFPVKDVFFAASITGKALGLYFGTHLQYQRIICITIITHWIVVLDRSVIIVVVALAKTT